MTSISVEQDPNRGNLYLYSVYGSVYFPFEQEFSLWILFWVTNFPSVKEYSI